MDRLEMMRIFVSVVEAGAFAAAARASNHSAAAVTRAVASLEESIGTRLLVRTTRSLKLTDAGGRYVADCRRILAEIADAEATAGGLAATPTGTLVVTAPVLLGQMHVLPILTEYLAQHPALVGRTLFTDQRINLIDDGADVAIRVGHLADSGHRAIRVGTTRLVTCASPQYLARLGIPTSPLDLAGHTLIAVTSTGAIGEWRFDRDEKTIVPIRPRLVCDSNQAAIEAAIRGWGITRARSYQIAEAVRDGRLRIVLAEHEKLPVPVHVVYAEGREAPAKVRLFVKLAAERLKTALADG